MSTADDLDALDRGVIECGLLAAQAMARAEAAERRAEELEARLTAHMRELAEIQHRTLALPQLSPPPDGEEAASAPPARHLRAIDGGKR